MKFLIGLIAALFFSAPYAMADLTKDPEQYPNTPVLRPIADQVEIKNVFKTSEQVEKTKLQMIEERSAANKKLDHEYKLLAAKPSWVRHPVKRGDLWIEYHQDTYRKFRTRVLPVAQFAGIFVGMGFSVASAL